MQKRESMKGNKNWETKGRKGKESVEGDHRPPLLFIYCQDLFDFSVTPPTPTHPDTPLLLFSTADTNGLISSPSNLDLKGSLRQSPVTLACFFEAGGCSLKRCHHF